MIAGKGADTEMELAGRSIPFDDRAVAREALRRRALVIPLELDVARAARPRRSPGRGPTPSPACRSTRAGSRRATSSSRSAAARTSSSTRSRAARPRRSSRTTPFAALGAIARRGARRARRRASSAITGSTGKTSTKDILFALCAPHRRTIANEGNYNTEIGVPLTLCRIEEDTEICISELGMRGLGQIAWLASFARPDIGVITNIGPVHLELVETIENVARAKAELIDALPAGRHRDRARTSRCSSRTSTRADIVDQARRRRRRRCRSRRATPRPTSSRTRALACAVAECLGVPLPTASCTVEFSKLREEELPLPGGGLLLNDCYNANPVSMRAALLHLAERGARHAGASRCSARWPSSAPRRAGLPRARSARCCASSASSR